MPTPNPSTRREYKGAAAATTLQNAISSTDVSLLLVAANNWPTGAVGKFIITINRGLADEEKVLCDSQTGRTVAFLLANRGFDGTTAQGHAAGATVECTLSAFDADEWNQHTNATTGVHGVAGTVVGTTDAQTLTNKTLTAPAINGGVSDVASTIGGVSGASLAADRTAWITTFTPVATNVPTSATGCHYKQIGKTVHATLQLNISGAATGTILATLPVAPLLTFGANDIPIGDGYGIHAGSSSAAIAVLQASSSKVYVQNAGGVWNASNPFVWANGDFVLVTVTYEAA